MLNCVLSRVSTADVNSLRAACLFLCFQSWPSKLISFCFIMQGLNVRLVLPLSAVSHTRTRTLCPYKHSNHKRIPTGCSSHTSQNGPFHTALGQEWGATYLTPLDSLDTLLYTTSQFIQSNSCFVFGSYLQILSLSACFTVLIHDSEGSQHVWTHTGNARCLRRLSVWA